MKLVLHFPFEEINNAIFLNSFLPLLKEKYEKIIIITPAKFACFFTNANSLFTIDDDILDKFNCNYPDLLERVKNFSTVRRRFHLAIYNTPFLRKYFYMFYRTPRQNEGFYKSGLLDYCLNLIKEKEGDFKFVPCNMFTEKLFILKQRLPYGNPEKLLGEILQTNFDRLAIYIKETRKLIEPILHDYIQVKAIRNKIHKLNKEHTVFIITRNFKNKQPQSNTDKKVVVPLIRVLLKQFNVVNIGFPPIALKSILNNENYLELNERLSYGDMLSIIGNDIFFITGMAAGFTAHMSAKLNVIIYEREWSEVCLSKKVSLFEARKSRRDVMTESIANEIENKEFEKILAKVKQMQLMMQ